MQARTRATLVRSTGRIERSYECLAHTRDEEPPHKERGCETRRRGPSQRGPPPARAGQAAVQPRRCLGHLGVFAAGQVAWQGAGGRSTRIPVPAAVAWRGMQVQWRRRCCQHLAAVSLTVAVRVRTTSHAGASWGPGKNLVFRQKSGTAAAERAPAARPEPHEAGVCAPTRMSRKAEAPAAASGRFQLVGGAPACAVTAEG